MSHDDSGLYTLTSGGKYSRYVSPDALTNSVHEGADCVFCHEGAAIEEFPHEGQLEPVNY